MAETATAERAGALAGGSPRLCLPSAPWAWLAVVAVVLTPLALAVPVPLSAKRSVNLTLWDPLVWLLGLWLGLSWLRSGAWRDVWRRVLAVLAPGLVMVAVGVLSVLGADLSTGAARALFAKGLVQWSEYLLVGPLVFAVLLDAGRWRRRAWFALAVATGVAALSVWGQWAWQAPAIRQAPALLGGILLNRNAYGVYLALALPLLLGGVVSAVRQRPGGVVPIALLFAGLALYPCLAGAAYLAAWVALAVTFGSCGRGRASHAWAALVAIVVAGHFVGPGAGHRLRSVQVYVDYRDAAAGRVSREHTLRYLRWSANLEMFAAHPRFGVGLGQYQKRLGPYYQLDRPLPEGRTDRPETFDIRTAEPFSFGWFFVAMGETGLPGLLAGLFLLTTLLWRGVELCRSGEPAGWALVGAGVGLFLLGWFASPLTRGAGGALALVLGASARGVRNREGDGC